VTTSGLFADVDGDGKTEAIFHGNLGAPLMLPADPGVQAKLNQTPPNAMPLRGKDDQGNELRGVEPTSIFGELSAANKDTMFPLFSHPSVGDLDMDGSLDVIAGGGSLSLLGALSSKTQLPPRPPQFLVSMWSSKTGKMLPGSPFPMEDYMFINSQAIADITGDGYPEVFTGSGGYLLHSFDACGREAKGFPKNTGQWILATTAIGDIDGDKKLEVVVGTRDGWLYAWHTDGSSDGVIQWESWHHDNQNTGNYGTKLTQGTTKKAGLAPLDCGAPAAGGAGGAGGGAGGGATSNGLGAVEVTGGCSVAEGGGGGSSLAWIAAAIAGLAARRRRTRGST
jgi:MYXO-CTERM domain-containing protein